MMSLKMCRNPLDSEISSWNNRSVVFLGSSSDMFQKLQAYEVEKKVCEAYDDFQRVVKLDSGNR